MDCLFNEHIEVILARLKSIENRLASLQKMPDDPFLDNQEFIQIMNISKRTAQNWRENGFVTFSQIGGKIYYRLSDINAMLDKHCTKAK